MPDGPERRPEADEAWLRSARNETSHVGIDAGDLVELWRQTAATWRGLRLSFDFLGQSAPPAPPAFASDFVRRYAQLQGFRSALDPYAVAPTFVGGIAA